MKAIEYYYHVVLFILPISLTENFSKFVEFVLQISITSWIKNATLTLLKMSTMYGYWSLRGN